MHITSQFEIQQEATRLEGAVKTFFDNFSLGTILRRGGIQKLKGASPLVIFRTIFLLPFEGHNFFRGVVGNTQLGFEKDAAYEFLENPRYNWRRFFQQLVIKIVTVCDLLTSEEREKALVVDDSTYDRSRSKKVELLAKVHDHNTGKYLNGFKLLTLGWTDGVTFLPLDFVLRSSADATKRICGVTKKLDKRSCGYKRRQEAMTKTTDLLEPMIKRVLALGLKADYILMDSWFCFASLIAKLANHAAVICMVKDLTSNFYLYQHVHLRLGELYKRVRKRPGKARILASVVVDMKNGPRVKIVFVRNRNGRGWLALLSTRIDLPDEEIVRIYGKRWDIEVFFKMAKHYLNLEKEVQLRDYDGLIGHNTIVFTRYAFLALEQRFQDDPKSLGSLFFACCSDMKDLSLLDALNRLLIAALNRVRAASELAEDFIDKMLDAVMGAAIEIIKSAQANRLITT
jgi:hypothetical protein